MRFRLLKNVLSVVSFVLPLSLGAQTPSSDVVSYKGRIDSIRSDAVRAAAVRPDGRYLFISRGNTSLNALDLQDMGLEGASTSVSGTIVDLFMSSSNEVVVAHQKGVDFLNATKPFALSSSTKYVRPDQRLSRNVIDSCLLKDRKIAFLEESSGADHFLVFVDGVSQTSEVAWSTMFPGVASSFRPKAIWCTADAVLVSAMEGAWGTQSQMRLARVSSSGASSASRLITLVDRVIVDAILSPARDQWVLLANRTASLGDRGDSQVMGFSVASLDSGATISVGSSARALAAFKSGQESRLGVFVGTFFPLDAASVSNRFVMTSLPLTSSSSFEGVWGEGSTSVGAIKPSHWVFSDADHYRYGISESSGVSLLGAGPRISVTVRPAADLITTSEPLRFGFSTDRNIQYQLRLEQNYSLTGTSSGLSREYGALIRSGSLNEGQNTGELSLSVADLSLYLEREMVLSVVAWDPTLPQESAPQTRIGIPFLYDQPPGEVKNLIVKSGDQSVHLYFEPPAGGDIDAYIVDYSFDEADLSSFDPNVAREFESGISGYRLISPKTVLSSNRTPFISLSPIENYRTLYFKVYAVDKRDQLTVSPQTQSAQAYRTRSLSDALGGAQSCSIRTGDQALTGQLIASLLGFALILLIVRFSGKKIGPSTSRNRRGGD